MPEILIVEQSGEVTPFSFKELPVCELYKKCGYRKQDENFQQHIKWSIKYKKKSYSSQYYTNGTIKTIDSIGYLKLKKKEKPFSILIEKKLVEQIDTTGLYSMKQNKKKLILNFHKQN